MTERSGIESMAEALSRQLDRAFGTGEVSLETALRKVGRRLPRRARRDGAKVAEAERMAAHPRLASRIDRDAVLRAGDRLRRNLEAVDPGAGRTDLILSILRSVAVNLLILAVGLLALARWRGWI